MSAIIAAPNAAKSSTRVLSICAQRELKTFCKVERNSNRNQESCVSFGNQPESPAKEYNPARANVPHMYITCQEVLRGRVKIFYPPISIEKSTLSIPRSQASDLVSTISNFKFEISNPGPDISNFKSERFSVKSVISNTKFQVSHFQLQVRAFNSEISNFKSEFALPTRCSPHPGGSPCVTQS
ncbi:MAG TPA: hypothetical protein VK709_16105 [Candidatus Saccharimonadales bacterium]|jgi:hypothetical protein|nr:hypothetical protein [Candidatus Saccharimonadales bacterium]